MFSYPLLTGAAETVLEKPNSIVLTKEMATKYFGTNDPMGKTLQLDSDYKLTVTGIMDAIPNNSHLDFDFIISIEILENIKWFNTWWINSLLTSVTASKYFGCVEAGSIRT